MKRTQMPNLVFNRHTKSALIIFRFGYKRGPFNMEGPKAQPDQIDYPTRNALSSWKLIFKKPGRDL